MGKSIIDAHKESVERHKEQFDIPEDIIQFMKDHTERTNECNKDSGGIDKSVFRLGMVSMYYHLKSTNKLK